MKEKLTIDNHDHEYKRIIQRENDECLKCGLLRSTIEGYERGADYKACCEYSIGYEKGFLEGKNEWGKKVMATEISFEEAVGKHIAQARASLRQELKNKIDEWLKKKSQHPSYYHALAKVLDILTAPPENTKHTL